MIPDWVGEYVGLPFRDFGRDRDGLDCWGLYRLVRGERWGQWLDGYDYGATRSDHAAEIGARASFLSEPIPAGQEQLGDAVFLRVAGLVCHLGMVIGEGMMLHALPHAGVTFEPYRHGMWVRRVEGFRRP